MTTVSLDAMRRNWPQTAAKLQQEGELIVVQDGLPVAKLVTVEPQDIARRKRLDPKAHLALLRELGEEGAGALAAEELQRERALE